MISSIVKPSDFFSVGNWDRVVFCDKSRTGIGIRGILDCSCVADVTFISSVVCDDGDIDDAGDICDCCIWVVVVGDVVVVVDAVECICM